MFKGFGGRQKKSVLEDNELTTGIVQHPVTKRDADRVAKQIADAWSQGKYKTQQEVTAGAMRFC